MPTDIISTLLVLDTPDQASIYPQVGTDSSKPDFQAIYWRCTCCFYATSVRQNPDAKHVLYTTADALPHVDGLDIRAFLEGIGVEVRTLPITHRLGPDKVKRWNNVFYVLDALKDLEARGGFSRVAILDSDCAWVRPADGMFLDVSRRGILTYSISYDEDQKLNDGSRVDMVGASRFLADIALDRPPHFAGGEILAATAEKVSELNVRLAAMWDRLMAAKPSDVDVYTEEHLLSIAYDQMDIPIGTADPHIRRMWTAIRLNNVTAEDIDSGRAVWHLPMEKKVGFKDLFRIVRDPSSWFWSVPPEELRLRIARTMGLPKRSARQWAMQAQSRIAFKGASLLGGFLQSGTGP